MYHKSTKFCWLFYFLDTKVVFLDKPIGMKKPKVESSRNKIESENSKQHPTSCTIESQSFSPITYTAPVSA
jgi:hypothetical protein